jgi:ketol-acid reductoisomerase
MLAFASAYNVAFGFIEAPPFVDVGLIAPRLMGAAVRERYQSGEGFSSFIAVGQDASGQTWPTLLALAKAVGALKAGAVEIGFEQEAALDLFTQQAILPAFYHLMKTAAHLLIEKGFPVEAVLTELYFSGEFAHFLRQVEYEGLITTLCRTPLTNQYGTLSRMERFNDLKLERLLEVTLDEIRSAKFAHEWAKEYADGRRRLETLLKNPENRELLDLEEQTLDLLGRAGGFDA